MNNFQSILSQINETLNSLPDWNNLSEFVSEFHDLPNSHQLFQRWTHLELTEKTLANQLGAEVVMALRAAYLSNSNRWSSFWLQRSTIKSMLA